MSIYEKLRVTANPIRMEIMQVLKDQGSLTPKEIGEKLESQIHQSQLSQHLTKLKIHELVKVDTRQGKRLYQVHQPNLDSVVEKVSCLAE